MAWRALEQELQNVAVRSTAASWRARPAARPVVHRSPSRQRTSRSRSSSVALASAQHVQIVRLESPIACAVS